MPSHDPSKADVIALLRVMEDQLAGLQRLIAQCSVMIGRIDKSESIPESPPMRSRDILNSLQAAEVLAVTEQCLRKWRCLGTTGPKYSKLGKFVRYRRSDLDAWIEQNSRESLDIRDGR
jgi:predicted DNA-binding transcriptional regulator AlpA